MLEPAKLLVLRGCGFRFVVAEAGRAFPWEWPPSPSIVTAIQYELNVCSMCCSCSTEHADRRPNCPNCNNMSREIRGKHGNSTGWR